MASFYTIAESLMASSDCISTVGFYVYFIIRLLPSLSDHNVWTAQQPTNQQQPHKIQQQQQLLQQKQKQHLQQQKSQYEHINVRTLSEEEVGALLAEDEDLVMSYAAKLPSAARQLTLAKTEELFKEPGAALTFLQTPDETLLPLLVQILWENDKVDPVGALRVG